MCTLRCHNVELFIIFQFTKFCNKYCHSLEINDASISFVQEIDSDAWEAFCRLSGFRENYTVGDISNNRPKDAKRCSKRSSDYLLQNDVACGQPIQP